MTLTREQIEQATNEQLREWVAEYVMKLPVTKKTVHKKDDFSSSRRVSYYNIVETWAGNSLIRNYPEDIAAAFSALDKLATHGWYWTLVNHAIPYRSFECSLSHPSPRRGCYLKDDTKERAICKAILLAIMELE